MRKRSIVIKLKRYYLDEYIFVYNYLSSQAELSKVQYKRTEGRTMLQVEVWQGEARYSKVQQSIQRKFEYKFKPTMRNICLPEVTRKI